MSWISDNYEKAAVGAAVLGAAGLAYFGSSKLGSVDADFGSVPNGPPAKSDPGVKSAGMVAATKSSFQLKREWTKGEDEGRSVDLFTGVALFVNKNELKKPVDLIEGQDVHPGIPNSWWLEYRIDPGFGDAPLRDEDEDGFTNQEEFTAKTDPSNEKEFPALITKLTYIGDESVQWVLRPGFEAEGGSFTFTYGDGKAINRVGAANPVPVGGIFFEKGAAAGRFKLLGSEKRMVLNEAIQAEEEVTFVSVEDQKPNKKGVVYVIPASFRTAEQRKFAHFDRTAVLSLQALGLAGQEFRIEENTAFALPIGESKKSYKMKEVTPERIVVEFTGEDGKVQTHEIIKGATGSAAP
ncbi:MAG: hypothetical protein RLZZ505_2549 [Verrucomicrobiota bacterium]|jgi:hypothetical protein